MNRVFVDMDGVIVDFERYMREHGLTGDETKIKPGAYLAMHEIPGAVDGIRKLLTLGYEIWIATKPPTGVAHAYSEKAQWIYDHIPELKRHIIITHHKGMLGDDGDIIIDDRLHKASINEFAGTAIGFVNGMTWDKVVVILEHRLTK